MEDKQGRVITGYHIFWYIVVGIIGWTLLNMILTGHGGAILDTLFGFNGSY